MSLLKYPRRNSVLLYKARISYRNKMEKTIFDFLDYKAYLKALIRSRPGGGRGFRSELAQAAGVQRTFITQVLGGSSHLSLEQAVRVSRFLGHSDEELDFLLLLIEYGRAGSELLREQLRRQIKARINERLVLRRRLQSQKALPLEAQLRYYSAWFYSAIRVALGVPELRTPEALSRRLSIPEATVREVLEFLLGCGMIQKNGAHYAGAPFHLHLGTDSALLTRLHSNWRIRALSSLQQEGPRDLHYSYAMSLSREDALELKAMLVKYLEELQRKVIASRDETVFALCLDFFEL